jgi:ABC-2 type transport system permease protein
VTEYGRGAAGMAGAAIGLAYVLRAVCDNIGDMGNGTLSWLSPIGGGAGHQVYVDDRWWPLLLALAVTAVLLAAATW